MPESLERGHDRLPVCPEHGLRPNVQSRDFCDVVDDFGHCGRFLLYEGNADYDAAVRASRKRRDA